MIFYFSGQLPVYRKEGDPNDPDILFFKENAGEYDRLICLMYDKEAETIMSNLTQVEVKHGYCNKTRATRRS